MTTSILFRRADPRLHRLLETVDEEAAVTIAAAAISGAPEEARDPRLELLVLLSNERAMPPVKGVTWRKVAGRIFSVLATPDEVRELAEHVLIIEPARSLTFAASGPSPEDDWPASYRPYPGFNSGEGVVIGFIDFGLDFTHPDFIEDTGETRIDAIWDQSLEAKPGEAHPHDYDYGVEYDRETINAAISSANPFNVVRHVAQPNSHGTHVCGVASSNGRGSGRPGVAPEASIIFVHPKIEDKVGGLLPGGVTSSARVVDAIRFIFDKALELGKPCVINMSLSHNASAHDGETLVERAIDELLQDPGQVIVVAAGNTADKRMHMVWDYADGEALESIWNIPASAGATLYPPIHELELWYPSRDVIVVELVTPAGTVVKRVSPNERYPTVVDGYDIEVNSSRFDPSNGDSRIYIRVADTDDVGAGAGTEWKLRLSAKGHSGPMHGWIEKVPDPDRQSIFSGDAHEPTGTVGAPASARRCLAVGNLESSSAVNASSSRGPTRDGRRKPELVAIGTGVVSTASRPDLTQVMVCSKSGTSAAAPFVAGVVAGLLQEDHTLTAKQVQAILIASANRQVFDDEWGYGEVDPRTALDLVRRYQ